MINILFSNYIYNAASFQQFLLDEAHMLKRTLVTESASIHTDWNLSAVSDIIKGSMNSQGRPQLISAFLRATAGY